MKEPEKFLVAFKPLDTLVKVPVGSTLMLAAEKANILLPAICGGKGKCGKCKIKIVHEQIPHTQEEEMVLTSEEIENNIHLACQVKLDRELEVEVLSIESSERVKQITYGTIAKYKIDDHLKKIYVELKPPDLNNPLDDLLNLESNIFNKHKKIHIPLSLLQNLSTFLRKNNYKVTFVLSNNQVLNIESGDTTSRRFGLAFDLGTTTIAGSLIDLKTGQDLAVYDKINPQYNYGTDVITRVNVSINEPGGLSKLQNIVIEAINEIIETLTQKASVNFREIYERT